MSSLTITLSDADDRAIAAAAALYNASRTEGTEPLTDAQYLRETIRGWLQSYKRELGRINSGLMISRIPRAKWANFFDGLDPAVVTFRDMLLNEPVLGRFSDSVAAGLDACVASGLLTRNQADALIE